MINAKSECACLDNFLIMGLQIDDVVIIIIIIIIEATRYLLPYSLFVDYFIIEATRYLLP
jgi:hypothetical protein